MRNLRKCTFGLGTVLVTVAIALTLVAPSAAATAAPSGAADAGSYCIEVSPWDPYVYFDPDCGGPLPPVSAPPSALALG